jgi:hypothetical protein
MVGPRTACRGISGELGSPLRPGAAVLGEYLSIPKKCGELLVHAGTPLLTQVAPGPLGPGNEVSSGASSGATVILVMGVRNGPRIQLVPAGPRPPPALVPRLHPRPPPIRAIIGRNLKRCKGRGLGGPINTGLHDWIDATSIYYEIP